MRLLLLNTLRTSYHLWLHSMSVCLFYTPAAAVTLSVSILLTVHWLAEIDGRSIVQLILLLTKKEHFFHRKLILIIPRLLFFLPFPRPPTKSLGFGLVLFAGWLAGSLVGSSG